MNIVVVTACLAGVAHSKMVAAGLKKECESRGYKCSVEMQSGSGITDKLSQEDINKADVVIIAKAISIAEKERFEGKKIYEIAINKAIRNLKGVLDKAVEIAEK